MAKKAKATQQSVMEQLAAYQPPWLEAEEKPDDKPDPNAGLVERLAKVEKDLEDARRQQIYQGFAAPAPVSTANPAPGKVSTEPDLTKMPDPWTHPAEYAQELLKRERAANEAKVAQERQAAAAAQEQSQLASNFMAGFKKAQPAWADQELLVGAITAQVANDFRARGVDVVKLAKAQPELLYGEVAGMLEKQYPQLKKTQEGDEAPAGGEDANRTAGVFGGTPGKKSADEGLLSVEDDNQQFLRGLAVERYKAGIR